ncbi:MAG TPA: hypothetical protein VGE52_14660 [Pirellulales bacterium]
MVNAVESSGVIRRIPPKSEIKADLARNLRERYILRDLLKLAERAEAVQQSEAARAS